MGSARVIVCVGVCVFVCVCVCVCVFWGVYAQLLLMAPSLVKGCVERLGARVSARVRVCARGRGWMYSCGWSDCGCTLYSVPTVLCVPHTPLVELFADPRTPSETGGG